MKRVEKYGNMLIKGLTLPVRIVVGVVNAVEKNMPDTLEFPYEVKKKSDKKGDVIDVKPIKDNRI
jgi:hypothetical protein